MRFYRVFTKYSGFRNNYTIFSWVCKEKCTKNNVKFMLQKLKRGVPKHSREDLYSVMGKAYYFIGRYLGHGAEDIAAVSAVCAAEISRAAAA